MKTLTGELLVPLSEVKRLEKRLGASVWDGVLFNNDGITDPRLTVLPNASGTRIRRFLYEEQRIETLAGTNI